MPLTSQQKRDAASLYSLLDLVRNRHVTKLNAPFSMNLAELGRWYARLRMIGDELDKAAMAATALLRQPAEFMAGLLFEDKPLAFAANEYPREHERAQAEEAAARAAERAAREMAFATASKPSADASVLPSDEETLAIPEDGAQGDIPKETADQRQIPLPLPEGEEFSAATDFLNAPADGGAAADPPAEDSSSDGPDPAPADGEPDNTGAGSPEWAWDDSAPPPPAPDPRTDEERLRDFNEARAVLLALLERACATLMAWAREGDETRFR